jgi:proteasome lid subunit RPN8/RPN11
MIGSTLAAIHAHALADYPREACGLVIVAKGRERYIPCRNMAEQPGDHFILSGRDFAAAEDEGEIMALAHSHPDAPARPSEADRVECEASGVPWLIVSVRTDDDGPYIAERAQIEPSGYVAPLVGRSFHHGVLDCWALCRDWYERECGLRLPNPERRDKWWNDGHSDLYMSNLADAGFNVLPQGAELRRGDLILM